jgi:ubiquinone/menaquinone biosynthesis C-methylase UbiE
MVSRTNENTTQLVRENYDRLARVYARRFLNELQFKPLDRELLNRFAVSVRGRGPVCEMGCGPGHIARYLKDAGTNVFGLDLSPGMIEQGRQLNPDISFQVGDMMALELGDQSLAGIVAFYAIVNISHKSLQSVFREMARVLEPGGLLLLAFHIGDEILRPGEVLDQPNSMDWFFFQPSDIRRYLEAAALSVEQTIVREPYAPEVEYQSPRAYIFARKPGSVT